MMYIWTAYNVEDQLPGLRDAVAYVERIVQPKHTVLDLPFHISLKISFYVEDDKYTDAINDIFEVCKTVKPETVKISGIEKNGNIVWIHHNTNNSLTSLHAKLDKMLLEKYNVVQHEYDKCFMYHSTLMIDDDIEKVQKVYEMMSSYRLPAVITPNRVVVGISPNGAFDTYHVYREITI